MSESGEIQIVSFYAFKDLRAVADLSVLKEQLKAAMKEIEIRGTIIIAEEGFNGMVCGVAWRVDSFVEQAGSILHTKFSVKSSFHAKAPFRKIDVKIKPEIVTLKKRVDVSLGKGTHVRADEWNEIASDPTTFLLDVRNDYEHKSGTFRGAVNPGTAKFSELPAFVEKHLDPQKHKRVAMFCTGGIRCEKFAPYLKQIGFKEVFQLEGGILKYLKETPPEETLWEGECFVFDERVTVDASLQKGSGPDHSQRHSNAKKSKYKIPE